METPPIIPKKLYFGRTTTNKRGFMMAEYGFNILWSDEDEGFIATCPDFPGLSAFGETSEEALDEANIALDLFIDTLQEEAFEKGFTCLKYT